MTKVKLEERLLVKMEVRFPDINENKSYTSIFRKFNLFIDGELTEEFNQNAKRHHTMYFKLRSVISVHKVFEDKLPDSTFTYRVGENFAILKNQYGKTKKIAVSFEKDNTLYIKTDIEFERLKDIS